LPDLMHGDVPQVQWYRNSLDCNIVAKGAPMSNLLRTH